MELNPPSLNTIDELARTDPFWQKVLYQEATTPQIKLFSLMTRISDAQVFIKDTIALYQTNRQALVSRKMRGVPNLISNPKFWKSSDGGPTKPSFDTVSILAKELEKATIEKIEKHYPQWVLNQGLVTFCTILDSYLDSTVDAIFQHKPKILYGVSGAKNIELKKIVELGSVEAVVREIRAKEIRTFSNDDIADRLNFFKTKLSIDTDRLFDWEYTAEETDRLLEGLDLKTLQDLYQKRHDIVHRDQTPIVNLQELDIVSTFFLNVCVKLALLIREKHGMWWDIQLLTSRNDRYKALKAQSESSS